MSLPQPGDTLLDKYRIESILGEGGFGRVYRATTVGTQRPVAIKFLKIDPTDHFSGRKKRFAREMKAIARLQSPYTVTLYDYGVTDEGASFMVCEYVAGEDLADLLRRRGPLSPAEAAHVIEQLLRSLAEAHEAGILHRDIKPANIRIFEYSGDPLRVKLLDFGLALSIAGDEARLTRTGLAIGTPRYMSPEQIRNVELVPASDLYSLGLVAYEMLVGAERNRELPPGRPRRLEPDDCPDDRLRRAVNGMLHIELDDRFESAEQVLRALERNSPRRNGIAAPPPPARPVPPAKHEPAVQPPDEVSGRAPIVLAALFTVIAIVTGVAAVLTLSPGDPDSDDVADTRATPAIVHSDELVIEPIARGSTAPPELETSRQPPPGEATAGCGRAPDFTGFGKLRLMEGLTARTLDAYVPPNYDPATAYPMIVLFHEKGADPAEFLMQSRFHQVEEPMIVIAPYGGFHDAWLVQAVDVIQQALDDATAMLCVDPDRIFAVAHSAGAVAKHIPCDLPRIRAFATTAGLRGKSTTYNCPTEPIPAIHLLGRDDRYNPLEGGVGCHGTDKMSLTTREAFWRRRNRCGPQGTVWFEHGDSTCHTWECETPLVSCVLDGGRGWVGTSPRALDLKGCDGEPANFPYAETIWRFFSQVTQPSATPESGGPKLR